MTDISVAAVISDASVSLVPLADNWGREEAPFLNFPLPAFCAAKKFCAGSISPSSSSVVGVLTFLSLFKLFKRSFKNIKYISSFSIGI